MYSIYSFVVCYSYNEYTVAEIKIVDKIIKISLLIIKVEYNRNAYKKK